MRSHRHRMASHAVFFVPTTNRCTHGPEALYLLLSGMGIRYLVDCPAMQDEGSVGGLVWSYRLVKLLCLGVGVFVSALLLLTVLYPWLGSYWLCVLAVAGVVIIVSMAVSRLVPWSEMRSEIITDVHAIMWLFVALFATALMPEPERLALGERAETMGRDGYMRTAQLLQWVVDYRPARRDGGATTAQLDPSGAEAPSPSTGDGAEEGEEKARAEAGEPVAAEDPDGGKASGAGPEGEGGRATPEPAVPKPFFDAYGVFSRRVKAIVTVIVGERRASGFVVDDSGVVVTSERLVRDAEAVEVRFGDGKTVKAKEWLDSAPAHDIALIRIPSAEGLTAIPLAEDADIRKKSRVVVMGDPLGLSPTLAEGHMAGPRSYGGQTVASLSIPLVEGASGGAVLDSDGALVGVARVFWEAQQERVVALAVPAGVVGSMLGPQYRSARSFSTVRP